MQKQTKYNIAETNIANLGSDLEKKIKEAASKKETAWATVKGQPGTLTWRIEKFKVKAVPEGTSGQFFDGDSYIILNTFKDAKNPNLIKHDIYFWLGDETTQDEAGTAAYKTVELNDYLKGGIAQHRETQGTESATFLSIFKTPIRILHGGIDSGFRHVSPEEYKPRLLQLKGRKRIRVTQVPLARDSLNKGDVFILDAGFRIWQLNGSESGLMEKNKAMQVSHAISDDRKGKAKVTVLDSENETDADFWAFFGGFGPIHTSSEGGDDEAPHREEKVLMKLSDTAGTVSFAEIATGTSINKSLLTSDDVYILDNGEEIFVWIGKSASVAEKKSAMDFAQKYLVEHNLPPYTPITRLVEGGESNAFKTSLKA